MIYPRIASGMKDAECLEYIKEHGIDTVSKRHARRTIIRWGLDRRMTQLARRLMVADIKAGMHRDYRVNKKIRPLPKEVRHNNPRNTEVSRILREEHCTRGHAVWVYELSMKAAAEAYSKFIEKLERIRSMEVFF